MSISSCILFEVLPVSLQLGGSVSSASQKPEKTEGKQRTNRQTGKVIPMRKLRSQDPRSAAEVLVLGSVILPTGGGLPAHHTDMFFICLSVCISVLAHFMVTNLPICPQLFSETAPHTSFSGRGARS